MLPPAPPADPASEPGSPLPELSRTLNAFLRARVPDATLAEDLTQECLLRIQSRLGTLRDAGRLHAWALQIARHVLVDHLRRTRPTEEFEESVHGTGHSHSDDSPSAEEDALTQRLHRYIRSAVERLPEPYREALQWTELEQRSQVEMARRLGVSVSAAKSRVQRGRALLRREMERCCRWETDRYGRVLSVEPRSPCASCARGDHAPRHK